MYPNNNLSVLPFYTDIRLQNHRRSYAYGEIYPLITLTDTLLPFQIIRPHRENGIESVKMYYKDGTLFADITQPMIETGLRIMRNRPYHDVDTILYAGTLPMALDTPDGVFYVELSDGVQTWYSEMFTVVQDVSGYVKIEWYDAEDLLMDGNVGIVYTDDDTVTTCFRNRVYLCTEIGKPEYTFSEEVNDRDGYSFPEKQVSEKTYRCTILAPEYLLDAMRFVRLSDFVQVTDQRGQTYKCDTFLFTPTWQTQGDLASVEIEFQTNTAVKRIGWGYSTANKGDFSNDFNNDYNNQ